MEARAERFVTEDEYTRLEEAASHKHEWLAGSVFAMAGGTPTHALLCLNAGRRS